VKRIILSILVLLAVGAPRASAANAALVCDAGADRVVYDGSTARYVTGTTFVGASTCGGTRMAMYSMRCDDHPAFRFYFASVPGPAILGGKSARLDVGGKSELLSCK
jgi:hypothetical protein